MRSVFSTSCDLAYEGQLTFPPTPPAEVRFGGQPYFNDFLNKNFKKEFNGMFGDKNGKAIMSATAGS